MSNEQTFLAVYLGSQMNEKMKAWPRLANTPGAPAGLAQHIGAVLHLLKHEGGPVQ